MKKCVLLTMDDTQGYQVHDQLLHQPLAELGWQAIDLSWKTVDVNWDEFDLVIIRSTWDYQEHCETFLQVLSDIENSTALLANSAKLVRWNINKHYLAELGKKGTKLVPSLWYNNLTPEILVSAFEQLGSEQIVIKPCISAGAFDTFLLDRQQADNSQTKLLSLFSNRQFMIQSFAQNIVVEGEFSVFYFNHQYSHCILKRPKTNDFRVQEEHGGQLILVEPEAKLLAAAEQVLSIIPEQSLYARLDFVRLDNCFAIMEAELIEPSLYFNMDKGSAGRFAKALVDYYAKQAK